MLPPIPVKDIAGIAGTRFSSRARATLFLVPVHLVLKHNRALDAWHDRIHERTKVTRHDQVHHRATIAISCWQQLRKRPQSLMSLLPRAAVVCLRAALIILEPETSRRVPLSLCLSLSLAGGESTVMSFRTNVPEGMVFPLRYREIFEMPNGMGDERVPRRYGGGFDPRI